MLRMRRRSWARTTKTTRHVEEHRRHREEIDGDEGVNVILQEAAPGLRRWLPSPRQVLRDRGLGDLDTELEQLAVDSRRTPHVGGGHALDERSDLGIDGWPATLGPAAPSPIPPKSCSMPSDHSGRLDDDQRIAPASPPAREQHPEPTVCVRQPWSLDRPLQDAELLAQREDFDGELTACADEGQCGEEQGSDEVQHGCGACSRQGPISMIPRWSRSSGGTAGSADAAECD